jgi:hypothetical protein
MEERPKRSENPSPQDEGGKINPGEVFLKKWMEAKPERAESEHSAKYHDGSKFKGMFRDVVMPKTAPMENEGELNIRGPEEAETGQDIEEASFDKRHEAKDSQQVHPSPAAKNQPEPAPEPPQISPEAADSSPATHIGKVIDEKARNIHGEHRQKEGKQRTWEQNTRIQSTAKQYITAVSYGFLAALLVLAAALIIKAL